MNTQTFRISTRPRLFLGALVLDILDAHPLTSLAVIVAVVAGTLAALVLA